MKQDVGDRGRRESSLSSWEARWGELSLMKKWGFSRWEVRGRRAVGKVWSWRVVGARGDKKSYGWKAGLRTDFAGSVEEERMQSYRQLGFSA